jgi:hypothetical protein
MFLQGKEARRVPGIVELEGRCLVDRYRDSASHGIGAIAAAMQGDRLRPPAAAPLGL